jgi:hypothetical protein
MTERIHRPAWPFFMVRGRWRRWGAEEASGGRFSFFRFFALPSIRKMLGQPFSSTHEWQPLISQASMKGEKL